MINITFCKNIENFFVAVSRRRSALGLDLFFFFDTIFSDGKIEAKRGLFYEKHF